MLEVAIIALSLAWMHSTRWEDFREAIVAPLPAASTDSRIADWVYG